MKIAAICLALAIFTIPAHGQVANLWASYSVNPQSGNWGFAIGRSSTNAAYNDARNGCGRAGCYELMSQYANCIALYVVNRNGRRSFGAGHGNSLAAAEAVAKRKFISQDGVRRIHGICTR